MTTGRINQVTCTIHAHVSGAEPGNDTRRPPKPGLHNQWGIVKVSHSPPTQFSASGSLGPPGTTTTLPVRRQLFVNSVQNASKSYLARGEQSPPRHNNSLWPHHISGSSNASRRKTRDPARWGIKQQNTLTDSQIIRQSMCPRHIFEDHTTGQSHCLSSERGKRPDTSSKLPNAKGRTQTRSAADPVLRALDSLTPTKGTGR